MPETTLESMFAPAFRAVGQELAADIESVRGNAAVDALMTSLGGMVAVLNEHRQILTINDAYLNSIGVGDAGNVIGLRPGETIRCVHAHEMPGGCGTGLYCQSCGMAIAIVASLVGDVSVERKCSVEVRKDGDTESLCFDVRASGFGLGARRFVLLLLQDITRQERQAALERTFLHDIRNLTVGILGASELARDGLLRGDRMEGLLSNLHRMTNRLAKEIEIHGILARGDCTEYRIEEEPVDVGVMLAEISGVVEAHPKAKGKIFDVLIEGAPAVVWTDAGLLIRILTNMIVNAFEATEREGVVRLSVGREGDAIAFSVWNRAPVSEMVARRIFKSHVSTKPEPGRGLGTFVMKLFGEKVLKGRVAFTSSEMLGTTFRFLLPLIPPGPVR